MSTFRNHLPQLDAPVFLTDGGCETTLVFHDGFDLPDFAAFPLLGDAAGRAALDRYLDAYAAVALRDGTGIVLESATWRASADWGARLGYDAAALDAANRDAIDQVLDARRRHQTSTTPVVVSGNIGPRGDGYVVGATMSADEARAYHASQVRTFASTDADLVTAMTMTYVDEASASPRPPPRRPSRWSSPSPSRRTATCPPAKRSATPSRPSTPPPVATPPTSW